MRRPSFQPLAIGLTGIAALLRLAPHPSNFTPIGGLALFGGSRLSGWQAYIVPLLAMALTDPILSHAAGYPVFSKETPVIYASVLVYVLIGRMLVGTSNSPWRIGAASLLGSIQFFLITNFVVWLDSGGFYAHTWSGLILCYTAALPFFSRSLLGDLFYSGALFASYALLTRTLGNRTARRQAL